MPKIEETTEEQSSGKGRIFTTQRSEETIAVGRELATLLAPPRLLILRGDLGAGKTTLVKGIAEGLNAAEAEEVTSPTFTLIHEYEGKTVANGKTSPVKLYHLDLYRIDGERQLETLGIDELAQPNSIILVEWGDKFPSIIKRSNGEIAIESAGGDGRTISIKLT